jgi:predicted transcriptional regulator
VIEGNGGEEALEELLDQTKFRILCTLQDGPLKAKEISEKSGVSISPTYTHIRRMLEKGLIEKDGEARYRKADLFKTEIKSLRVDFQQERVEVEER